MRVLFFGNSPNSLPPLRVLAESQHQIVGVVSPRGRTPKTRWGRFKRDARQTLVRQLAKTPWAQHWAAQTGALDAALASLAHAHGAKLLRPSNVNDPAFVEAFCALKPDVVVMVGFNQILKAPLIAALPPILNVHPSALPNYRGPAPLFWLLAQGETATGVTLHQVTAGVDTGPIVAQTLFEVPPWFTSGNLRARCGQLAGEILLDALNRYTKLNRQTQDSLGSYYGRVTAQDLIAPFEQGATAVYNRARAATPDHALRLFVPNDWWRRGGRVKSAKACVTLRDDTAELALRDAVIAAGVAQGKSGTVDFDTTRGLTLHCEGGSILFRQVQTNR